MDYNNKRCTPEYCFYYRIVYKQGDFWNVEDYYAAEQTLQMRGQYIDDSLTIAFGTFYYYDKSGRLESIEHYKGGKLDGLHKEFDKNGRLSDSLFFKNGVLSSLGFRWEDGILRSKGLYDDEGKGTGEEWCYYPNGVLADYGKMSDGYVRDSIWTHYFPDGSISCKEYFKNGSLENTECFDAITHKKVRCKDTRHLTVNLNKQLNRLEKKYAKEIALCKKQVNGKKGRMVCNVCLDTDGSIKPEIVQSYSPCVDTIFLKILSEIQVEPIILHNRPTKDCDLFPIDFN